MTWTLVFFLEMTEKCVNFFSACKDLLHTFAFLRYNYMIFANLWINGTGKLKIYDQNNVSGSSGSKDKKHRFLLPSPPPHWGPIR